MTIGEKIKSLRQKRCLTQSELCGSYITRNLLSEIECGKATPSVSTLKFIAEQLGISAAYFLTDSDDYLFFEKIAVIDQIIFLYKNKNYSECIKIIEGLSSTDDELSYILANCHFSLAKSSVLSGALLSAKKHIDAAKQFSALTAYDTSEIENLLLMYSALAENIQSPLLEFDLKRFNDGIDPEFELELYRYIIGDYDYAYKNSTYAKHVMAKRLMKDRRYNEALPLLDAIIGEKNPQTYNSYVMFGVYTDMEYCYKQLANFQAAYKFASKRLSMLEGFKA